MEGEPSRMETGVASEMIEKAGYRLVSSDSHVVEPPDLWTRFIDPEYRHRAPRVVREDGFDRWYADGDVSFGIVGSDTQAGRRFEAPESIRIEGLYEDVRRGGYDPHAHVEDMDLDGVSGDVVYPSVGLETWLIPSTDLLSAVFRAYNDWLAEFCAPYPDRIKGMAMVNVDVVADGVGELRRAASLGLAGATIPQRPLFGRYDGAMYGPLWEAAEALGMPLAMHSGTSRWIPNEKATFGNSRGMVEFINQEYDMRDNVVAMIFSGVFERHPGLKVGLVEYEVSWAPYLLYRMDVAYQEIRRPERFGGRRFSGDMLPSDMFRRNMFICFQEDGLGMQMREYLGVETLMWGNDYPHAESTFPRSKEIVERILEGVPLEEKRLIAGENCARLFKMG